MSDSSTSPGRRAKLFLGAVGIFVVFGFLAVIFSGFVESKGPAERAFGGEFDEATVEQRRSNLAEVEAAQEEMLDEAKLKAAMEAVAESPTKAIKTEVAVPGSPTFLEQAQQSGEAPAAETPDAEEAPAETPAEGETPPDSKPEAPDPGKQPPAAEAEAKKAADSDGDSAPAKNEAAKDAADENAAEPEQPEESEQPER
ncbi:MAG: hypothetical protein WD342_16380 [Verrucomicrobiales bacterium]